MLDQIPLEILISIFGLLEHGDLKAVRQTCKMCYEASLAYSITKYEVIHFNTRMLKPGGKQIIRSLMETKRNFSNISISNINYSDYFWFFHKFAKSIKTITLRECTLNNYQFTSILSKLEVLEKLHLNKCDTLLIEGKVFLPYILEQNQFLKNLKCLEISNSTYLTDECLSRFLILFPNILKLSIEAITVECHQGSFGLYYKPNTDLLKNPSNQLLTSNYLKALIISKKHNIQGLDFSKTLINNVALSVILQQKEIDLKYLNLNKCRELRYDNNVTSFCKNNMTELQLSGCSLITNNLLFHITSTMVNLKVLNISDNENIDDDGFKNVANLYYLSELDVSNCNISGPLVETVLCSKPLSENLKIIKLNYLKVTNSNLVNILNSVNLIELQISNCPGLSNQFLKTLWCTQKLLRRLDMGSIEISDMGITGLEESKLSLPNINFKKYESSYISNAVLQNEILDDSIYYYNLILQSDINNNNGLNNLKGLVSLNLNRCRLISDYLFSIPLRLKNLRELNLCGMEDISSRGIMLLVHNCPSIENLDISGSLVDDIGICVLVRKLHRLKCLQIRFCKKISNVSLQFIKEFCKVLQILNLQDCYNLDADLLQEIKNMPSIVQVIGRSIKRVLLNDRLPIAPPPPVYL